MLYVKGITIHMMDTSTLPGGKLQNLNHFFFVLDTTLCDKVCQ